MFASTALPLPSAFHREPRPLRLTPEQSRPQPQGNCHYQQGNIPGQSCLCQTYHHDRSLAGNTCDCGHSACYHSQSSGQSKVSPDRVVSALVEKVKKLEEYVINERETRSRTQTQERQAWEREIRVLHEALAPFYQNISDMKQRLIELETRLDSNCDNQSRLRERVNVLDESSIILGKGLEHLEATQSNRKRKASVSHEVSGVMSPTSNYTNSSSSAMSDTPSLSAQRSSQPPSPMNLMLTGCSLIESPRSSGVLNLASCRLEGLSHYRPAHQIDPAGPNEEPRSSGFLAIDLAERLRTQKLYSNGFKNNHESRIVGQSTANLNKGHMISSGLPSPPQGKNSTRALPLSSLLTPSLGVAVDSRPPKRYKPENRGTMALEILANATVDQTAA